SGAARGLPRPPVNADYAGMTFGYNRSLCAQRVHDILTAIAHAKHQTNSRSVALAGFGEAGPWALLAAGLSDGALSGVAADLNRSGYETVAATTDEMMPPGARR